MAFQVFPPEYELLSFFEVEPEIFGDTVITYQREHNGETLFCSFSPDYGDIDLTLLHQGTKKVELHLSYVRSVEIIRPDGREQLRVAFPDNLPLQDFLLAVKPEVTFLWGTTLDKG
jgi:hypothetical protein